MSGTAAPRRYRVDESRGGWRVHGAPIDQCHPCAWPGAWPVVACFGSFDAASAYVVAVQRRQAIQIRSERIWSNGHPYRGGARRAPDLRRPANA